MALFLINGVSQEKVHWDIHGGNFMITKEQSLKNSGYCQFFTSHSL